MSKIVRYLLISLITIGLGATTTFGFDAGAYFNKKCKSCHGVDGIKAKGKNPNLAGQNKKYTLKALKDYKSGKRKNGAMKSQTKKLDDAQMKAIADYLATK